MNESCEKEENMLENHSRMAGSARSPFEVWEHEFKGSILRAMPPL